MGDDLGHLWSKRARKDLNTERLGAILNFPAVTGPKLFAGNKAEMAIYEEVGSRQSAIALREFIYLMIPLMSEILMSNTEKSDDDHLSVDGVRHQLLSYENQIKEYLDKLEATVDTYKFSVEKHDEGLTIDIALRATIHAKKSDHK
jgi:hypothetical protein